MFRLKRAPLSAGAFALALTALALVTALLARPLLEPNSFLPFLGAVLASAWYYGLGGGLAATVLSTAAVLYFFIPPGSSFVALDIYEAVRLGSFLTLAVLISVLVSSQRRSRNLLLSTLAAIGEGMIVTDRKGRVTYINPVAAELTGWRPQEAKGKSAGEIVRLERGESHEQAPNPAGKALLEAVTVSPPGQVTLVSRDGNRIPVEHSATPMRDRKGEPRGSILLIRDVSGRRRLEEQVSHSQKMDAIGRLASGVAGDFNNVLTVITGYSDMLRADLSSTSPLRSYADEIMWAAERAAGLTRQLLAFSRGAAAQPRLLDLNNTLAAMEPMLRRLLGEQVELIVLSGPGLGRINADPSQMEQVVMNLATNARDAMPQGGKLVLETANVDLEDPSRSQKVGVKPGSYVMLAVSDTGLGMDPVTRSRLFEPLFTTKEPGKGSGLGLSTVYGIVKQSEGQITVYSQPSCGTIFEIYLPRATEATPSRAPTRRTTRAKGSETILLVDDEDGVRKLISAILSTHGYEVMEASGGPSALASFEKNAHKIDLVLTDIVMPQMNGFELVEQLLKEHPLLKILFMSGYRDNPIGAPGSGERAFLHKPFTPDTLLEKVREVLDSSTVPDAGNVPG